VRIELGGRTKGDRGLRCDRGGGEGTEPPSSPFLSLLPFLLLVVVVVVVLVLQCCYVRLQLWQVNLGEREFVLFLFLFFVFVFVFPSFRACRPKSKQDCAGYHILLLS